MQQHVSQGIYYYKVENFTSFGTISCSADNSYGTSGPCLYHIMVAGECVISRLSISHFVLIEMIAA